MIFFTLSSNIEQYEILMWGCNILLVAHCILFCKNTLGDLFSVLKFLKRFIQWTIRCMQKMKLWQFALDLLDLPNSDLSWNFVAENIEMKITQVTKVEEITPASNFNTLRCSQTGCWKKSWDVAKMFVANRGRADTGILAINSGNQNTFAQCTSTNEKADFWFLRNQIYGSSVAVSKCVLILHKLRRILISWNLKQRPVEVAEERQRK